MVREPVAEMDVGALDRDRLVHAFQPHGALPIAPSEINDPEA
jgi:hypothetical protein